MRSARPAFNRGLTFFSVVCLCGAVSGCGSSQASAPKSSGSEIFGNSRLAIHSDPPTTVSTLVANPCSVTVDLGRWSDLNLAGQMLVSSANIGSLQSADPVVQGGVGGIVLMGNASSQALGPEISSLVSNAPQGIRPLVMTDEEGGAIQRLAGLVGSMPWPRTMASSMSLAAVENMS